MGLANRFRPATQPADPLSKLALEQGKQGGAQVGARTRREPGSPPELPNREEVEDALKRPQFTDFSRTLEGLHNRVHGWVGGHMGIIPFAAFDPVFWAHHTMIDRIWRHRLLRSDGSGMTRFHSEPLDLPADRTDVARADLIFYGVDHSGPTYEARIFFAVGRWADLRRRDKEAYTPNVLALGDFNLPVQDETDPVFRALTRKGLHLPPHSTKVGGSNLSDDAQYDQMGVFPGAMEEAIDRPASSTTTAPSSATSGVRPKPNEPNSAPT